MLFTQDEIRHLTLPLGIDRKGRTESLMGKAERVLPIRRGHTQGVFGSALLPFTVVRTDSATAEQFVRVKVALAGAAIREQK
jgi:hypothetical protein